MDTRLLDLEITDRHSLSLLYMPFLRGGGIFVPGQDVFKMGSSVVLLLELPDDYARCVVLGRVAWLSPKNRQNPCKPAGAGMQFMENEGKLKARIENILAGEVDSDENTATTMTL